MVHIYRRRGGEGGAAVFRFFNSYLDTTNGQMPLVLFKLIIQSDGQMSLILGEHSVLSRFVEDLRACSVSRHF